MSDKDSKVELEENGLEKVSGGRASISISSGYGGYSAEDFNNIAIGDRVKGYNILGDRRTYYGTVRSLRVEITSIGNFFYVRVEWDGVSASGNNTVERLASEVEKI